MTKRVSSIITRAPDRFACGDCGCSYDTLELAKQCEEGPCLPHAAYQPKQASWRQNIARGGFKAPPAAHPDDDEMLGDRCAERAAALSDHVDACVKLLRKQVARLAGGAAPEDIGPEVELIGRMMSRRT